jgi:hypothetical protein
LLVETSARRVRGTAPSPTRECALSIAREWQGSSRRADWEWTCG